MVKAGNNASKVLGCLQFTSPAWKLKARDRWIGWDSETRESNLQQVVQNSRFLILPWVKVKGLASHVLGLSARQLGKDWESDYGIRPVLLESFVDKARFSGTCYKAANWLNLGDTQGRGRMDREHLQAIPVKSVWVYPLHVDSMIAAIALFENLTSNHAWSIIFANANKYSASCLHRFCKAYGGGKEV